MIWWILSVGLTLVLVAFLFWRVWFCRKPQRRIPNRGIVSPANGRVAIVRPFALKERVSKWNRGSVELLCSDVAPRGTLVLIIMTPLHVHYQRVPVAGTVEQVTYRPGRFRNAVLKGEQFGTIENERNEILLKTRKGRIKVVQIAGVLARRISCFVREGDKVKKGGLLGFINVGSQVALILPETCTVRVRPGDRVIDGETVIA